VKALIIAILVCAAGIGFNAFLYGPEVIERSAKGGNDFAVFYTGGNLAFSPNLYDIHAFRSEEERLTGWTGEQLVFVRLPWQAVEFAPLTLVSFQTARILWFVISMAALFFFGRCWPEVPLVARVGVIAWSVPAANAVLGGQDIPLLALALAGGLLLIQRQQPVWAGLCLALCSAKPHLFWLLALVIAWHRMWKVLAGAVAGTAILLAISFLNNGAGWIAGFMRAVAYVSAIDTQSKLTHMPTIAAILSGAPGADTLRLCAVLLAIAAVVLVKNWRTGAAIALIFGVLTASHAFLQDCTFVLVSFFLVWKQSTQRTALLVACSPLGTLPAVFGHPGLTVLVLLASAVFLTVTAIKGIREATPEPAPIG
jgi:hypothetical protein